ncbi:uncharacterized protein N0V89_007293 [Didymosphaeria variabile]|uniref:Uncharacterized protein n=1 Tax=Didymosphaeria variabile TaxID=1932322 RepID=A0A9W8XKT0_9PLEO|nr:uncharacterized protein N0V89_007293 [Didymosphaeria variabile]KAJ4351948.1 hypothetical protein N0V89_007293 [Didymosphaeria variabile]
MVDAFKGRWKAKLFAKDHAGDSPPEDPKPKTQTSFKLNEDVNDFLKPSTERAQAHKEAAASAFLSTAGRPKIDVVSAQRWPSSNDVLNSAAGKNGGLRKGSRKKGLTVSFVRTQPDVIGEGGDECEEPSIEVYNRKKSNSVSDMDKLAAQSHRDDIALGARSPKFDALASHNAQAAQRGIVTRTLTSGGELSPPLRQKLEMGSINTHASPPPEPAKGLGHMGLGQRPKPLTRAPTGFDIVETEGQTNDPRRPSMDSAYSFESENISPVLSKKVPELPPMQEEEENFRPKPLSRTQTGWSEHAGDSDNEPAPAVPPLPGMKETESDSPIDAKAVLAERYLQSEPADPNSYSARVIHKMRADEGNALHEAAQRATDHSKSDSGSSASSFQPGSVQSSGFAVGTPPATVTMLAGKTPPRFATRDLGPAPESPQRALDVEDPYRSRARGPSPGRGPMPPGTLPLDTDPRPSSSSSGHTMPSAASRTRTSPHEQNSAATTASIQQTPSTLENQPFSAVRQTSIVPTPPQFERQAFASPPRAEQPPAPPPHREMPAQQTAPSNQRPLRPRHDTATSTLGRSDTKVQAEGAFLDFGERVEHMRGVFQLMAQLNGQIYDHAPTVWLRVASWWFLKGRAAMETAIRSRVKTAEQQPERLIQAHVDLAKTWWILAEVFANHPKLRKFGDQQMASQANAAREAGDEHSAEAYDAHDAILSALKMLLGSMKRHQSMPPTQALIQGQQQDIWETYPKFAPDAASVLSAASAKLIVADGQQPRINPMKFMPVSDTKADFCYFRMFAQVSMSTEDLNTDRAVFPVVISVLRSRDNFNVKLAISSQTELVNIMVGPSADLGATWKDVSWRSKSHGFALQLRHGFVLNVELLDSDFRSLWNIVDHTNRVDSALRERSDEQAACVMMLREGIYKDPTNPAAFPAEPVRGSKLLLFEKFDLSSEGTGKRKLHRGYRVVMVTHPRNRTVGFVTHEAGTKQEPLNFAYTTEPDQAPSLVIRFREEMPDKRMKICTMRMVFGDSKERNHIFGLLTSLNTGESEKMFAQVPLKAYNIESADPAEGFSQSGSNVLNKLQWLEAKTMNQDPDVFGLESAPTVMSESLRILCRHSAGVFSDRMNLDTGELLVRLPTSGAPELTFLRNPQRDMAIAVDASRSDKDIPDALADLLRTLINASTIRRLTFASYQDLHAFQLAVTGFSVRFDGIASTLSIARRRMVVPIYKQWTANTIRIQIVEQDNIVQLLAFFEEFSHADAMNFQLKPQDEFQKTDKGGKSSVRLVDCKFALPVEERKGEGKMGKEEGRLTGWAGMKRRFVCLDQIEYPGEHDDIVISFDSQETRDKFAEALPSATVSRKFTVRRKI